MSQQLNQLVMLAHYWDSYHNDQEFVATIFVTLGVCNIAISPVKVLFRLYDDRLFVTYGRSTS